MLRQEGRARPLSPPELVDEVVAGLDRVLERHEGEPTEAAAAEDAARGRAARPARRARSPPSASASSRRCSRTSSPAAATRRARPSRRRSSSSASTSRYDQLDDHLQLLNLVNFGGGCYAVYASLDGDEVRVDKELFGDAFRRPPRLTPLEARAIRLALEFVGPMIAAEAQTPLERVRKKLEETFGEFAMPETAEAEAGSEEEQLIRRSRRRSASSGSSRSSTSPSARRRASG